MTRPGWRTVGSGAPVTIVVPGLGATDGEGRIAAAGLPGTRVIVTLPGHGDAPDAPAGYWDYRTVAADVRAVADETSATRALGVSLGAGALTRLVADTPDRFERLALLLPAVMDVPRRVDAVWALTALAEAVDHAAATGDEAPLTALVAAGTPEGVDVGQHTRARVAALRRLGPALHALPDQVVVSDRAVLARVRVPVVVISAVDDPLHPEPVARSVAAAFAESRLEVIPSPAPMITHRRRIRGILERAWA